MGMIRADCWCCKRQKIYVNQFSKLCKKCEKQLEKEVEIELEKKRAKAKE